VLRLRSCHDFKFPGDDIEFVVVSNFCNDLGLVHIVLVFIIFLFFESLFCPNNTFDLLHEIIALHADIFLIMLKGEVLLS